jgi:RNA polymerase sigma-70 factor, ECF subfamily
MSPRSTSNLNDHAAFSRAYLQHARAVHQVAMAVLDDHARAQDVVQDVFLRLWRRPEAFDARRGALGPFLRMMARSRALDVRREQQAVHRMNDRLRVATEPLTAPADGGYAPEREDIRRALRGLPAGQREALVLTYWGGLTAEELARHADVPLGTAKSRVRLGVMRLRSAWDDVAAA